MKLIFATNNQHKVDEIQHIIGNKFEVVSLKEAGIGIDIPEPHDTLEANAVEKSSTIFKLTDTDCFSEDTGLEVDALNGEPGVRSARYAGDVKDFNKNIEKLLLKLGNEENRKARFRTVISLIINKQQHVFEGVCEGEIIYSPKGTNGFGYDSVFVPKGGDKKTFAEMTMAEKNAFSHRKKATEKLVLFLNKLNIR
jgi:XTP/dITP diphosphohydrolase